MVTAHSAAFLCFYYLQMCCSMKATGKSGSVPQRSVLQPLPKGWTVITQLTLTSVMVKKKKISLQQGKSCSASKSCELGKIHPIIVNPLFTPQIWMKRLQNRSHFLWDFVEVLWRRKWAKNMSTYKQEKEEEVGNIKQLKKFPFLEKYMHLIMKESANIWVITWRNNHPTGSCVGQILSKQLHDRQRKQLTVYTSFGQAFCTVVLKLSLTKVV